ncbi:mitochondrial carrier domain-containing protein [Pyrenochaeta sp. MPI-SDFR-AT-0127]|nr:mitochondrial carrier domain-containing protein [Pyrenochaeta sp. MPI-SDFR-AT-0127]
MDRSRGPQSAAAGIIAGSLAGASETFVTYPAEFVKTRRQLQSLTTGNVSASSIRILRSTLQNPGVRGIYAGCQTLAISNAMKSGVRFISFETAKQKLAFVLQPIFGTGTMEKNPWLNLAAGICAGATESILVVTPGERLKTIVVHDAALGGQLNRMPLSRIFGQTIRRDGFLSLWRGLTPVICKQGTNSAVRFTSFGALKDQLSKIWPDNINGTAATIIAGAGSGVLTVYASMPFDKVKTRMQSIGSPGQRMISVAAHMFATEGARVFWKATTPRLVRLTLSSSITFTVYDYSRKVIDSLTTTRTGRNFLMR